MVYAAIIHDIRRAKKDNTFPVKLRITYQQKQKYFGLGIDLTVRDFEKLSTNRLSEESTVIKKAILDAEVKAHAVIDRLKPFSFAEFEKRFAQPLAVKRALSTVYDEIISSLRERGRVGTADSYKSAYNSFLVFRKNLSFEDVTVSFLYEYERWMLERGRSKTTVSIHVRAMRVFFNEAVAQRLVSPEVYPFGRRKYRIPFGRNIKKALRIHEIESIYNYIPENESEALAKDLWIFSYFANGLNIKDIAYLTYEKIDGDFIVLERAKTEHTVRSNPLPISIYVNEDLEDIIKRRGNPKLSIDTYVFPILTQGADDDRKRAEFKQFTQVQNKWLKRIGIKLGLSIKLTTGVARHSFSTQLKRSGASPAFIQEALGHTSATTTQYYLDSFENELKKHFSTALAPFKKTA